MALNVIQQVELEMPESPGRLENAEVQTARASASELLVPEVPDEANPPEGTARLKADLIAGSWEVQDIP